MTKKLIGLGEFLELPAELQFEMLHRDGVYVGKRKVADQAVLLMQLYGFYVEVYYKAYRKEIDRIVTSDQTDILTPYLDQINIKDFNKNENDL